jgi:hypothetical protein
MNNQDKSLFDNMVAVANAHKASAELLDVANQLISLKSKEQGIKGPGGRLLNFDQVILTRIVIYGINIEILLKAICLSDTGVKPKGHDWEVLFNMLPSSRQQEIISKLQPEFQADFTNLLLRNKDIFINWRYTYEHTNLNCDISFVQNFANVVGSVALNID